MIYFESEADYQRALRELENGYEHLDRELWYLDFDRECCLYIEF